MASFDEQLIRQDVRRMIEIVASKISALKNKVERTDLIQQSYEIVLRNRNIISTKMENNVLIFCKYCLKNHLLKYVRSFKRDAIFLSNPIDDEFDETNHGLVTEKMSSKDLGDGVLMDIDLEDYIILEKYMNNLNQQDREILELVFIHGCTGKEIGVIKGVSQQWADLIKQRAIGKIKLQIESEEKEFDNAKNK